jgi:hypothetical protein
MVTLLSIVALMARSLFLQRIRRKDLLGGGVKG